MSDTPTLDFLQTAEEAFVFTYRGQEYYDHNERIYTMDGLLLGVVANRGDQFAFFACDEEGNTIYQGGGNMPSASDKDGNLIHDGAMEGLLAVHYNRALDAMREAGLI